MARKVVDKSGGCWKDERLHEMRVREKEEKEDAICIDITVTSACTNERGMNESKE